MKLLRSFFKQKETLLGISAAIAFQVIFVFVWLTAYEGVYDRTDQFKVGIVNDDTEAGKMLTEEFAQGTWFETVTFPSLQEAKEELNERAITMLIHLPAQMTEKLQKNTRTVPIYYYINQGTPTLTKQMMEKMAGELNGQVNQHIQNELGNQLAENIPKMIGAKSDHKEMAEQVASEAVEMMQKSSQNTSIQDKIMKTNDKEGFAATMVPLLIVLASYIGAMLVSQHLQLSEAKLKSKYRMSSLFIGRQLINIFVAVAVSLLTVCLMYLFNIEIDRGFFALWGFQSILMFSFLALSQIFVMLFGNIGMIFNIALTATQLVSSGAIVPRELLPSFYQWIGKILPATYGVSSYFSFIYGGGNLASDMKYLWIIIVSLLIIAIGGLLIVYLWGKGKQKSPGVS